MLGQIFAFMLKLDLMPILYNEIRSATLPLSTFGVEYEMVKASTFIT